MIPDFQTLMRPVLQSASEGEVRISTVVDKLALEFNLTEEEKNEMLPSGRQARFANRVHWAKAYLKQAALVKLTKHAFFEITDRGREVLLTNETINISFLEKYEEFQKFRSQSKGEESLDELKNSSLEIPNTPDEVLRAAHKKINDTLSSELLDRIRDASPAFFENLIVQLLLSMGYGGTSEDAGRALGKSGDGGIDGVIDQDPLGVDQIYMQAKKYADGNNIGAGAIRDFFGALSLKKAQKGIFVTTSNFSASAVQTAKDLGSRIVLIDGLQLAKLCIRYNIGCRDEEILHIKKIDEDFFEN
jgi:restriction system protein